MPGVAPAVPSDHVHEHLGDLVALEVLPVAVACRHPVDLVSCRGTPGTPRVGAGLRAPSFKSPLCLRPDARARTGSCHCIPLRLVSTPRRALYKGLVLPSPDTSTSTLTRPRWLREVPESESSRGQTLTPTVVVTYASDLGRSPTRRRCLTRGWSSGGSRVLDRRRCALLCLLDLFPEQSEEGLES